MTTESAKKQEFYDEEPIGGESPRLRAGEDLRRMPFREFMKKARRKSREIRARYTAELAENAEHDE